MSVVTQLGLIWGVMVPVMILGWVWQERHSNAGIVYVLWSIGLGLAAVALAWGSPWMGLAWVGPVSMYVFLRWISGIAFTEAQGLRTRGEDYREYQRTTSMLFPWFPKSTASVRSLS